MPTPSHRTKPTSAFYKTLLYRFHLAVSAVNILACVIDLYAQRYTSASIEFAVAALIGINAWLLRRRLPLKPAALIFFVIVATGLFTHIAINHFGTMSLIFILLLPLTLMLVMEIRYSVLLEAVMIVVMGVLLYREYRYNPANPIIQNPEALFHLAYAAAIIYIFGLLYHISIRTTLKELDASDRKNRLLLKEVHHRVKNNLNVIASIIGLQANHLQGNEKELLIKSKWRIESIAMVHEMLYRSDNLASIDFRAYVQKLADLLLRMYASQGRIAIHIKSEVAALPLETMVQLGIMINEMLTNSIKYAFENGKGNIYVRLERKQEEYILTYRDDGKGADAEALRQSDSLGLKLINLTAKQLGGNVTIENRDGLVYIIRFAHA